jgi:hypothetical protein
MGADHRQDLLWALIVAVKEVTRRGEQGLLRFKQLTMGDFPPKMAVLATWDICSPNWAFYTSLNGLSCQNTR